MPAQPGEETLVILFADVHYFLSPPTYKPSHHRFDKGSFVYLHKNAAQNRGRLEVANNAGTPDQDAFTGYLDAVQIAYNYKQPALLTISIDQAAAQSSSHQSSQQVPQWQLPSYDQKNENKYLYKLDTIDIYFYTPENAASFLSSTQQFLPPEHVKILNAPAAPPAPRDTISPVVQKLEQAAITTPYPSRHDSVSSGVSQQKSQTPVSATSYQPPGPGPQTQTPVSSSSYPPPGSVSRVGAGPASPTPPSAGQQSAAEFAPMAYNPAAPAAPEPIKHREKTPPPPEDGTASGLTPTTSLTHGQPVNAQYTPSYTPSYFQQTSQTQSYFPGQPQSQAQSYMPGQPHPQPYMPGQSQTQSSPPPTQHHTYIPGQPQQPGAFPGPPQPQSSVAAYQSATSPPVPGTTSPYQTPTLPATTTSAYSPPPAPHFQPTPPIGGYSTYSYSATGQPQTTSPPAQNPYDVHAQAYRPTQAEAGGHQPYGGAAGPGQAPGRFEQRAGKLEKGVNSFLKRLDKKF